MKNYVFDASAVLEVIDTQAKQSVIKEITDIFSLADRGKTFLYVPSIFFYEVSNALRYTWNHDQETLQEKQRVIFNLPFKLFAFKTLHFIQITELALRQGCSVYDTSYHYLANLLHQELRSQG